MELLLNLLFKLLIPACAVQFPHDQRGSQRGSWCPGHSSGWSVPGAGWLSRRWWCWPRPGWRSAPCNKPLHPRWWSPSPWSGSEKPWGKHRIFHKHKVHYYDNHVFVLLHQVLVSHYLENKSLIHICCMWMSQRSLTFQYSSAKLRLNMGLETSQWKTHSISFALMLFLTHFLEFTEGSASHTSDRKKRKGRNYLLWNSSSPGKV